MCKRDACYIGCTTQKLNVRIDLHILSMDYTAAMSNQNSSSAFARHLLNNPVCKAAYNPTTFTILETTSNELNLPVQNTNKHCVSKTVLFTAFIQQPYITMVRKYYHSHRFFRLTVIFSICFLPPPSMLFDGLYSKSNTSYINLSISEEIWPKRKVHFFRILKYSIWF